jgi:hypothetical protein
MMMPFQGCGSETRSKNSFYYQIISKNPERVIAFRVGKRPINMDSIFNVMGQQVLTAKIQGEQQLDVSRLPNGLYIIQTKQGETVRFLKE